MRLPKDEMGLAFVIPPLGGMGGVPSFRLKAGLRIAVTSAWLSTSGRIRSLALAPTANAAGVWLGGRCGNAFARILRAGSVFRR